MNYRCILILGVFFITTLQAQTDTLAVQSIKGITDKMLGLISGDVDEPRNGEAYRMLFLPTAQKTALHPDGKPGKQVRTWNIEEFIRTIVPLYAKYGFEEVSTGLTVNEYNGIATAFQSCYVKNLKGSYEKRGINCYQLVYTDNRSWIANTIFVPESEGNPIPEQYLDEKE